MPRLVIAKEGRNGIIGAEHAPILNLAKRTLEIRRVIAPDLVPH
jgi:hypothetical protein